MDFYGFLAWAIVQRVTLPMCIFHRFHSAVTLAEIWKTSYKARLEWTDPRWSIEVVRYFQNDWAHYWHKTTVKQEKLLFINFDSIHLIRECDLVSSIVCVLRKVFVLKYCVSLVLFQLTLYHDYWIILIYQYLYKCNIILYIKYSLKEKPKYS